MILIVPDRSRDPDRGRDILILFMPRLVDTHCHLNFKDFDIDRDKIIGQCLNKDIWMINVGVDYKTSKEIIELAEKHKKGVYATIAIHPHNVDKIDFDKKKFTELVKNKKVVAIGETGLDYMFCENDEKVQELQKKVFIQHFDLAKELGKPVIIHSRRLFPEILEIIKKQGTMNNEQKLRGVLHCYMGRWTYAEEYLKLGFYIGFTGLIVYARDYDKVIRNVPLDRILIETDAPYLSPIRQAQGKPQRNTPLNIKYIAQKIAEIKEISFEKVADQTTKNAKELFNIV